ncbi:hypothetical protein C7Y72_19805 [Paraconexibacter algicola]|uniref:Metallo-beta-lactamase domain-containing protein n=1 Tax=Paraconexibacter algicola TaxID=2133960 RepID=A0A2T4UC74_9ACTN|nr:hypothetical protein C7Y72_19805 [Paraconexibacter algicola]
MPGVARLAGGHGGQARRGARRDPRVSGDPWAGARAVGIHALPIPTPFLVGRVNCYLIEDEPLTLVDCGPNSGRALDELERALAAHGRRVEDLERIVITHQHADHQGLAGILARRSGAEVCALDALAPWLAGYAQETVLDEEFTQLLLAAHGVPRPVANALAAVSHAFRGWGGACPVDRPLPDGGTLEFAGRTLRVLHRPGHSPSDTVLLDEARGVLLGGDHLLAHISSNPLIQRPLGRPADAPRPHALATYIASMRTTAATDLELVLPGHGEPFADHRALVADRERLHERRAAKIARLVEDEPLSAHEVARRMWGDAAESQALLTLSEVLGHTDLLLADGRVREDVGDDGVVRFSAA